MAQALCNDEILRRLGMPREQLDGAPVRAVSAGLTALPGRPFSAASQSTLQQLGVIPHEHSSQEVTPELVEQAERIFCMTEDQCKTLISRFPAAASKVRRLDPEGDMDDPSGQDLAAFLFVGRAAPEVGACLRLGDRFFLKKRGHRSIDNPDYWEFSVNAALTWLREVVFSRWPS